MDVKFRSISDERFALLPEPPELTTTGTAGIQDPYYQCLEAYITALQERCQEIQRKELELLGKHIEDLHGKKEDANQVNSSFLSDLRALRNRRQQYRKMQRDALDERLNYFDSMLQQQQEMEYLRYKFWKLHAIPDTTESLNGNISDIFAWVGLFFQVAFFAFVIAGVEYKKNPTPNGGDNMAESNLGFPNRVDDYFTFWTHISMMIFLGFGLAGSWLKKFAYGSIVFAFLLGCFTLQYSFLAYGLFWNIWRDDFVEIPMTLNLIIVAGYGAVACLVSYGALLGKVTPLHFLLLGFVESCLWALNYYINILVLEAVDTGGGMTTHVFGAFFGIGVALFINKRYIENDASFHTHKEPNLNSSYQSDITALIGTIVLWVTFPSFNAVLAPDTAQHRVIIQSFLSLSASCVVGFTLSRVFNGKLFSMRDVQGMTLAGGVGIASAHALVEEPAVGLIVGAVSAACAHLWAHFAAPFFEKTFESLKVSGSILVRTQDTRNIFAIHGIPGIISGIASIIATAMTNEVRYGVDLNDTDGWFTRGSPRQAGFQTCCLFISMGIGFVGGAVSGALLAAVDPKPEDPPFCDDAYFVVPPDYPFFNRRS